MEYTSTIIVHKETRFLPINFRIYARLMLNAGIILMLFVVDGFCQDRISYHFLENKTLVDDYDYTVTNCSSQKTDKCWTIGPTHERDLVYFGHGGRVFDYGSNDSGDILKLDVWTPTPSGGKSTIFLSDYRLFFRHEYEDDISTRIFSFHGNECTIYQTNISKDRKFLNIDNKIERRSCRLIDGHLKR